MFICYDMENLKINFLSINLRKGHERALDEEFMEAEERSCGTPTSSHHTDSLHSGNAGGFVWDDDDYITNNQTLGSLEGLGQIRT